MSHPQPVMGLTACCAPCPQYDAKLRGYLQEYEKAFLVHADNVGSRQFMDIRAVRIGRLSVWERAIIEADCMWAIAAGGYRSCGVMLPAW